MLGKRVKWSVPQGINTWSTFQWHLYMFKMTVLILIGYDLDNLLRYVCDFSAAMETTSCNLILDLVSFVLQYKLQILTMLFSQFL